jgi:hypothetical protein
MTKQVLWRLLVLTGALGIVLILGCSDDDTVNDPNNQAPTIQAMTAEPDTFVADDLSTITVSATDPDGDPLTYSWEVHEASFMGLPSGGHILEVTNCCHVEDTVTGVVLAIVSDDRGGETRDSVQVWVIPRE